MTKNQRLVGLLSLITVGMFGFGFALVPLYQVFCELTGINGKTSGQAAVATGIVDAERQVTVEFITYLSKGMNWQFEPKVNRITVSPGKVYHVAFIAKNVSDKQMTGQAVPSVSPGIAANYFNKTECFCFTQQVLTAQERVEMPLIFFVDPDLPKNISTLTLAYTLYDVTI